MSKKYLSWLIAVMLIWIASTGSVTVSYADAGVCEIEGIAYATLQEALAAVNSNETKTIKLLQDIIHNHSIIVDNGRDVTIDLNGYDLEVNADTDHGLKAVGGSLTVSDDDGGGEFTVNSNLDQKSAVYAGAGGVIEITGDAAATGGSTNVIGALADGGTIRIEGNVSGFNAGAYAYNGGILHITGDVAGEVYAAYARLNGTIYITGSAIADIQNGMQAEDGSSISITGSTSGGAIAINNSTIHVGGNTTGESYGAVAYAGSTITVEGDASITGSSGFVLDADDSTITVLGNVNTAGKGPTVNNGGEITINGTVTALASQYAYVNGVAKTASNYEAVTTKTGYRTYYNAGSGGVDPSSVWVEISDAAEISGTGYVNLQEALAAVNSNETKTIKLLQDIIHNQSIFVGSGKDITIDLNGHDLEVNGDMNDHGLKAVGGSLTISDDDGDGTFAVKSNQGDKSAVYAGAGGVIEIAGNAVAEGGVYSQAVFGAWAEYGGIIRVIGDVTGYNAGIFVNNGQVDVTGTVNGKIYGIYAPANGAIEVDGDVTAFYFDGVYVQSNGNLKVTGNVTGGVNSSVGVKSTDCTIVVEGNVSGSSQAVYAEGTGSVTVEGNASVTGSGGYALTSYDCPITVKGNVTASGAGATANNGGEITIDGAVTAAADRYANLNGVAKTAGDYEAVTTKTGYRTFYNAGSEGISPASVWVKIPAAPAVPGKISFALSGAGAYEGNYTEHTVIKVKRTGGKDGAVSVNYAFGSGTAVPGTHYQAASGTVNWADGEDGVKYIPYTIYDDGSYNGYVNFYVTLTDPTGGASISGSNSIQIQISDNETPPVPTGLSATAGNGSVDLSWNSVMDAYYTVSYSSNPDAVTGGNSTGVWDAHTKTITGLNNGTTYYFAVKSGHNIFFSEFSNPVSATPAAPSGGGSGGGGGGSIQASPSPTVYQIEAGNTTTGLELNTTLNGDGFRANATEEIFDAILEKAIAKGAVTGTDDLEIKIAGQNAAGIEVTLPRTSLRQITQETDAGMKLTAPIASVRFDEKAIDTIFDTTEGSNTIQVSVGIIDSKTLRADDQQKVDGRPVYDFSVSAGSGQVSDFKGGFASISIPYTLKNGEDPNAVVIYYLSDDGKLELVRGFYNAETGTALFKTGHFSSFIIGYQSNRFDDVAPGSWYKDAVAFTAARGIVTGLDEKTFGPAKSLTRAQFITMFLRAYGVDPMESTVGQENFADAGNTWYTDSLLTAKTMGITNGIGNNLFAPNREITRQEMFVMLYNGLKVMGEIEVGKDSAVLLNSFKDSHDIAPWSKEAAAALVADGIVTGNNNKLNPTTHTTRAEMAQIIYQLMTW